MLKFPSDKKAYVIGERGLEEELDAVGIKHSGGTVTFSPSSHIRKSLIKLRLQDPEDNVFVDLMDFSSIVEDKEVGAVVCGLDMHINYKKIAKAHRYLKENEGCLFIATNLDSTFPTHGSVYPGEFSSSLNFLEERSSTSFEKRNRRGFDDCSFDLLCWERSAGDWQTRVCNVGKYLIDVSSALLLQHFRRLAKRFFLRVHRFGLEKSRTIMVGDRLDTDIKFGVQGGIDTLMVLTGKSTPSSVELSIVAKRILTFFNLSFAGVNQRPDFEREGAVAVPTYVVNGLGDFSVLA